VVVSQETIRESFADAKELDPAERIRVEVARLAKLDRAGYLAERKATAKALGIPATELDKLVEKARPAPEVAAREPLAPLPPEASPEPVIPRAVLDEVRDFLRRFIVVDAHALIAIALWIAFTHCFEVAETSPRLAILSPTKRCGKSRLLELLAALCPSALSASNLTPSAVFRTIDAEKCVLLIDEADTFTRDNEDLRGLLNSGHTRASAYVIRSVPSGDDWAPKKFSTWAPVAVAAIGRLPETWIDRSIVISMKRKRPAQKVERLTRRHVKARGQASALASKFARMAADNLGTLRQAAPASPEVLNDRAADNWEALFSIADLAGGDWPDSARAAAKSLSGDDGDDSLSIRLLTDIRDLFKQHGKEDRIGSTELCEKLCALELAPWSTLARGKPLTPARLARMLKSFEVYPRKAASRNEYLNSDFADAISLYAPYPHDESSKATQTIGRVGRNAISEVPLDGTMKRAESPTQSGVSGTMEVSNGGMASDREISATEEAEIDRLAVDEGERF
jgi:putative DNA primase/helicase